MKNVETVPAESLEPGMRVAAVVADHAGRVLLPSGVELTEATITSLRRRGIEAIEIERQVEEDPVVQERRLERVRADLGRRFRRAGEGEETLALFEAVSRYRQGAQP